MASLARDDLRRKEKLASYSRQVLILWFFVLFVANLLYATDTASEASYWSSKNGFVKLRPLLALRPSLARRSAHTMKYAIWILVVLLLVFHQDYWQWNEATLDFGFLPRAMTYHVILSVVAAGVWLSATKYCWPKWLDEGAEHSTRENVRT